MFPYTPNPPNVSINAPVLEFVLSVESVIVTGFCISTFPCNIELPVTVNLVEVKLLETVKLLCPEILPDTVKLVNVPNVVIFD